MPPRFPGTLLTPIRVFCSLGSQTLLMGQKKDAIELLSTKL